MEKIAIYKPKSDSELTEMKKADLIAYIRELEREKKPDGVWVISDGRMNCLGFLTRKEDTERLLELDRKYCGEMTAGYLKSLDGTALSSAEKYLIRCVFEFTSPYRQEEPRFDPQEGYALRTYVKKEDWEDELVQIDPDMCWDDDGYALRVEFVMPICTMEEQEKKARELVDAWWSTDEAQENLRKFYGLPSEI